MPLELYNATAPRTPGKMGRQAARTPVSLHYLADYVTLPAAPDAVVRDQLRSVVWGMLGNDTVGDCTFAGLVHAVMAVGALLGVSITVPDAQALVREYLVFDHGVDQGAVESTVLHTAFTSGIGGQRLAGYAQGRGGVAEAEQIVNTFGSSYDGVMLTNSDMEQFQAGQPWHLTSDRTVIGGHCIVRVEYTRSAGMFKSVTWGVEHLVEYEWYEARCDEQWAPIPQVVKDHGSLEDVSWTLLEDDLHALTNAVA